MGGCVAKNNIGSFLDGNGGYNIIHGLGVIPFPENYCMKLSTICENEVSITPSQGDGWLIRTSFGYIDYRHLPDQSTNEIWWVESKKKGHGSELVDLMQRNHPADAIAWGAVSKAGEGLMRKWHAAHPEVECVEGAHEGQFDPFGD